MTRDEVLAMKPGRELDALVAEKVMGWTDFSPIDPTIDYGIGVNGYRRNYAKDPESGRNTHFPFYSTDIAAAWEVVEKMHEWGGCEISCCGTGKKRWYVVHTYTDAKIQRGITVTSHTAPEAICKVALLAVMGL